MGRALGDGSREFASCSRARCEELVQLTGEILSLRCRLDVATQGPVAALGARTDADEHGERCALKLDEEAALLEIERCRLRARLSEGRSQIARERARAETWSRRASGLLAELREARERHEEEVRALGVAWQGLGTGDREDVLYPSAEPMSWGNGAFDGAHCSATACGDGGV